MDRVYSIGVASQLLGVCINTLRRWDGARKISCVRTVGGHRRFSLQEIQRILGICSRKAHDKDMIKNDSNQCVVYGRVSSPKQLIRGDLKRQLDDLTRVARESHPVVYKTYRDVGSGLNQNRKGLWQLIRDARKGMFSTV